MFVVEFAKRILDSLNIATSDERAAYVRGYFDTEGCVPKSKKSRYYIYFAQKDLNDLEQVKQYLMELGIHCGKTHNPSQKIDPEYYRFYILSRSFDDFARKIGSWHPIKMKNLRMKI